MSRHPSDRANRRRSRLRLAPGASGVAVVAGLLMAGSRRSRPS